MAIFLDKNDKVIVQGMTGAEGQKHTRRMLGAGTQIVGGTNPRKAGQSIEFEVEPIGYGKDNREARTVAVPVFGTVEEAKDATGAEVSVIFVPPAFAKEAVINAVDAGMRLVVIITEGIPVKDASEFLSYAQKKGVQLIGPNCPGIITPGQSNVGITPPDITGPGKIGLVSKSGTLTYQMMYELADIGISTAIGIGGDPIIGTTHIDAIKAFEEDPETELIVMIGEIGGDAEERAATYIKENVSKPVVAYVAGFTAPEGKTMGHAGAIVSGSAGTAEAKKEALEAVGVKVGKTPTETANLAREILANR
ncbi:succinyl-CoA synthetase alpha subunit [Trueperella bonasi]|uniref:Succinate--CoA ligase [ADP-forming] subunit alpha n=1 Tax=Trueperella bonasi TaxID=312286 RepID=A0ABT9NG57_9ACTO|nr:succinate--CoA ligase subunit alpha [Trueperella bonasi]MDP9805818.1 succinyl-CoA synthetase alpha subunit [Trueperella bonasi]